MTLVKSADETLNVGPADFVLCVPLGLNINGTATMRYQHVAAGRVDALAERLSAFARAMV